MTGDATESRLLAEVEGVAVAAAKGAGEILTRYFGSLGDVDYKDERRTDPVTRADTETEEYVAGIVRERFPDHGVLGEEGTGDDDSPAPDFVWAIDPLDGTNDFVGGLPIFASSIGVLYRGVPVAGAVYVPWPGTTTGRVFHARRGAGAFADDERLTPLTSEAGDGRLAAVPGSFQSAFRVGPAARDHVGEVRTLGSIAYELAMTAAGVVRYTFIMRTSLWDCAAGAAIVAEAGGEVRVGRWDPAAVADGARAEAGASRSARRLECGPDALRVAQMEGAADRRQAGRRSGPGRRDQAAPQAAPETALADGTSDHRSPSGGGSRYKLRSP